MDQDFVGTGGVWMRRYWEYGPLVLDTQDYRAFVFDQDLQLTESEFEALDYLARRDTASLESLYRAVWQPPEDGKDGRENARHGMENISAKLNSAGKGIVRIDTLSDGVYILRLRGQRYDKKQ